MPTDSAQLTAALKQCNSEAERVVMREHWIIADGFYGPENQERPLFAPAMLRHMREGDLQCAVHCEQIWIDRAAARAA